jgi:signal transduction histidine kinase
MFASPFTCPRRANPSHFLHMDSHTKLQIKVMGTIGGLGLLAIVGFVDYITGYELTFLVFYLLPILFVLRYVGTGSAFVMAVVAAFVCLFADREAGQHYQDYLTPIWNTGIRMSIFVLVVILFSTRNHLKKLVDQRTKKLQTEIRERSRLEKELLEIAESEQQRIGHDLHDSLGQHLTATALAGKILANRLANKSLVEPAMADGVVFMIEEAIELTRNLARNLHPIELGADGLEEALENLAGNISKAFNTSCRFQRSGAVVLKDEKAGIHLYRIAQEAVSNAVRHGRARNIVIALDAVGESTMMSVTDDGTGLPAAAHTKKGMGLRIMNFRADLVGATFDIQNLSAGGTRMVCVLNPSSADIENHADEN